VAVVVRGEGVGSSSSSSSEGAGEARLLLTPQQQVLYLKEQRRELRFRFTSNAIGGVAAVSVTVDSDDAAASTELLAVLSACSNAVLRDLIAVEMGGTGGTGGTGAAASASASAPPSLQPAAAAAAALPAEEDDFSAHSVLGKAPGPSSHQAPENRGGGHKPGPPSPPPVLLITVFLGSTPLSITTHIPVLVLGL
jgi:hypothetical protein